MFSVDESGEDGVEEGAEARDVLSEFVEYITRRKMVVLEDLAAHFGMRAADAVAHVRELEAEGRITGIFDDRGKFIYISEAELQRVADFIMERGRVSIADLARESNLLVDLEERPEAEVDEGAAAAVMADLEEDDPSARPSTSGA